MYDTIRLIYDAIDIRYDDDVRNHIPSYSIMRIIYYSTSIKPLQLVSVINFHLGTRSNPFSSPMQMCLCCVLICVAINDDVRFAQFSAAAARWMGDDELRATRSSFHWGPMSIWRYLHVMSFSLSFFVVAVVCVYTTEPLSRSLHQQQQQINDKANI